MHVHKEGKPWNESFEPFIFRRTQIYDGNWETIHKESLVSSNAAEFSLLICSHV